jgi:phage/plasmid primase-like uncharacterized protein
MESPKRAGEAGWLHVLRHDGRRPDRRTIHVPEAQERPILDLAAYARQCSATVLPHALTQFGVSLGLTADALRRLGTGWSRRHSAWTFPMRDAAGNVLGIRLRLPEGEKLSVRGGREGLFIPEALDHGGRLLIAEGPSDTAALLDLGFPAAGRPSCTGGVKLLVELVKRLEVPEVVIVADGDLSGLRGAESLAAVLLAYCPAVRVITPPAGVKDAREWKRRGATAADVLSVIDAAVVRKLAVKTTVRNRKAGACHGR